MDKIDGLRERLEARYTVRDEFSTTRPLVNPDGPEASAALAQLQGEVERLREANKVLRDGYADAASGLRYVRQEYGRLSGVGFERVDDHYFEWVTMPEREGLTAGSHKIAALKPKDQSNG